MKNLTSAFLIILILAFCYQPIAGKCLSCPEECCFEVGTGSSISLSRISSYRRTSPNCGMDAVVLETKKGRKMCVEAKAPWVKKVMKRIPKTRHE